MGKRIKPDRLIYIIGVIAFIIGSLDPLEGSVLITPGIFLITISLFLSNDNKKKLFLVLSCMVLVGVGFMFYFSSLGGFGGKSTLSWWWGMLILPYPVGWLTVVVLLILRAAKKR